MSSEITVLHKITNTIRRASKIAQNSRAAERFKIRDDQGNDVGPFLQSNFLNYINDRYHVASQEIRQRLASSMVLRRKRLLYRQERYGKSPIHLPQTASSPAAVYEAQNDRIGLFSRRGYYPLPHMATEMDISGKSGKINHIYDGAALPSIFHPPSQVNDRPPGIFLRESEIMTTLGDAERPAKTRIIAEPSHSVMDSSETATTFSPEDYKKAAAPSIVSISKTIQLSNEDNLVFPPAPKGAFTRRFNRSEQDIEERYKQRLSTIDGYYEGVDMAAMVPGDVQAVFVARTARDRALAKAREDCIMAVSEVTCPYCFHVLPIREVLDELKWK